VKQGIFEVTPCDDLRNDPHDGAFGGDFFGVEHLSEQLERKRERERKKERKRERERERERETGGEGLFSSNRRARARNEQNREGVKTYHGTTEHLTVVFFATTD
jgi:hypothetical protein